jgi:hypothetical protein
MIHWHVRTFKDGEPDLDIGYLNKKETQNAFHQYVLGVISECDMLNKHTCVKEIANSRATFIEGHVDDEVVIVTCEDGNCSLTSIEGG